jgi:type VI protein secretion system component Hcp
LYSFLRLPGIRGEAAQSDHVEEIELTDVTFDLTSRGTGTASSFGRVVSKKGPGSSFGPGVVILTKRHDKASSALFQAYVQNTTFDEAIVTVLTLSNKVVVQYRFNTLVLQTAPRYIPSPIGNGERIESLRFDFASVEVTQAAGPLPLPNTNFEFEIRASSTKP